MHGRDVAKRSDMDAGAATTTIKYITGTQEAVVGAETGAASLVVLDAVRESPCAIANDELGGGGNGGDSHSSLYCMEAMF